MDLRGKGICPWKGAPVRSSKKVYNGSKSSVAVCVACSKEHHVLNGVTAVLA